jgi:UDP-N-acetylmuramyl pentapeptide phosphotransferase/UDP-N-acetylglucosamine-1-phosphate transferase
MPCFAACLAILVTIAAGYPILGEFRRRKLGKSYSGDEPEAYAAKAGTSTMGDLIFIAGIVVAAIPSLSCGTDTCCRRCSRCRRRVALAPTTTSRP